MKSLFNWITTISLRFQIITIILVIITIVLGIVAATQLQQELIPPVEFPQTIVLAQVGGMTSEQALKIITEPIEQELSTIPEIVNIETTTIGGFGTVVTAANDFGLNQKRLQEEIQSALDRVNLPLREIRPVNGQDPTEFASSLLNDLSADVLLYIANRNSNFLFQLSPDVWTSLSDDTIGQLAAYLATQEKQNTGAQSALEQLVEQELVPQLRSLEVIANVQVNGGQALPGEEDTFGAASTEVIEASAENSLLLQLAPEVWDVISERSGYGELNVETVNTLREMTVTMPAESPSLPDSWQLTGESDEDNPLLQFDRFITADDLLEISSAASSVAGILNSFAETGYIRGPIGQTDDLTPQVVTALLEIAPEMVTYFEAEQLVAMPDDVFAVLPEDYINDLDGFTRDALAAAALASSLTNTSVDHESVALPGAWRIQPPRIITFSFDDLPLATFSVRATGELTSDSTQAATDDDTDQTTTTDVETSQTTTPAFEDASEGPALPKIMQFIGEIFGAQLDTADDMLSIPVPEAFAETLGTDTFDAATFFNTLTFLSDPSVLSGGGTDTSAAPAGFDLDSVDLTKLPAALQECGISILGLDFQNLNFAELVIGCIDADVVEYLVETDPNFADSLQAEVYNYFSDDVLALNAITPPLPEDWSVLSGQPQFAEMALNTADDVIALGNGAASTVLNKINETVPAQFSGYEVRLFNSLTPVLTRYFMTHEPDFYSHLDTDVLLKMSDAVLAQLPDDVMSSLDADTTASVQAIVSGEQPTAIAQLAELYQTDVPPADPDAPALNVDWQLIANFLNVELNNAYDFFRYPDALGTPSQFINGLFNTGQGAAFAPSLLGGMSLDAFNFIAENDPTFVDSLDAQALQLLAEDVYEALPDDAKERAEAGEVFIPSRSVTRTNGAPSLLVTVYKASGANVVETFHAVEDLINEIDAADETIGMSVVFEQASFIETSIEGVAREGSLGAIFAIIIILIFLSGGLWGKQGRRITGIVMIVLFGGLLYWAVSLGLDAAGGDFGLAFAETDVVVKVLLILGILFGGVIVLWPGSLPYPSWRSTLVIGVSIPLSLLMALAGMQWLSPAINSILAPSAESSDLVAFLIRLFPANLTLNIMTLSGLTVAIGRVVDDSIVVLENIFKQMQTGMSKRDAILSGTRDVSVAIFSATGIAVVVFLPLGLTGGIIGEFFLPFGLAVTYALAGSFIVAITVVPVLAYMFIDSKHVPEEEGENWMQRLYVPVLRWALSSSATRFTVLVIAVISMVIGVMLLANRPFTFLPAFGEPQISISVSMPQGTKILETNELVVQMEQFVKETVDPEQLIAMRTTVGGGGLSLESFLGGGSVSENAASIEVSVKSQDYLEAVTADLRVGAEEIFGESHVTVSAGTLTDAGFGDFQMVVSGLPQDELAKLDPVITAALEEIDGVTNVTSNLAQTGSGNGPVTYIRVNGESALDYTADLETADTLGVTDEAIQAIQGLPELPEGVKVSPGFTSELQQEGFQSLFQAMGIAIGIVILILVVNFGSLVYWLSLILSIVVAPVGAAVALTISDRALGISALIGLLMLFGLVVTNAIVLIDRVQSNQHERGMGLYDALIEAGGRRLRPIIMTALATIIALIPLAVGLSEGAIIASELGTVVMGGIISSTLLTLLVVPVAFSLLTPIHRRLSFGRGSSADKS